MRVAFCSRYLEIVYMQAEKVVRKTLSGGLDRACAVVDIE